MSSTAVTKVVYKWDEAELREKKAVAICDIVLDSKLKLRDVRLYRKEGKYFLVFPSKQDLYKKIQQMNPGLKLNLPLPRNSGVENGKFEEFFFPVDSAFYAQLLEIVVDGYSSLGSINIKKNKGLVYYPNSGGCNGKEEGTDISKR